MEAFKSNEKYDIIFCLSAAEHCNNLKASIDTLDKLLDNIGVCYFAVNCHTRNSTAKLWRKYNKIIDPMHPYQHTVNEYKELLSKKFNITDKKISVGW